MKVKFGQDHIIEVLMNAAEMEAIVGGYHGDAFGVLGPHPIGVETNKRKWEIRAFLPQASAAFVLENGTEIPMRKEHRDGLFAANTKREPGSYRIRIEDYHGGTRILDDPYRFGTII